MADMSIYGALGAKPINPLDQASKAIGVAQQAQTLDASKFELALKQLGVLRGVTASYLSDPDAGKTDLTKKVQDDMSKLAGMGLYTPQQVVQFLKGFPSDPNQQYKFFVQTHAQTLGAMEQIGAVFGAIQAQNTGPDIRGIQVPSYPGLPARERFGIHQGLPPTATTPNEETRQPQYLGTGQPAPLQQGPGSVQQTPPRTPMARPGVPAAPPVMADFPLGSGAADVAGAGSLAAEREAAATYQERVNPVRSAIEILSGMDPKALGNIGPGSEQFNRMKSAAVTWGLGEIAGVDPNKVADFNKLRKYFEDAASRRAAGLGPKTNDGLASALTASPNAKLDRLSALDLSKVNLALDRMRQAMLLEFDSIRRPPGDFNQWRSRWAAQQDPRAFIYDLMDAKAQAKLEADFKRNPEQRRRFMNSLNLAEKHQLLGDVREGNITVEPVRR